MYRSIFLFGLFVAHGLCVLANVRLPAIIGDHMVLQQNSKVKIWGWADPNEKITLKADWDTTNFHTESSPRATWEIELNTPGAGASHQIIINGYNKIVINDVVFGEVWVCSGQSNMEMNINWGLTQYASDASNATDTSIRFFYIPKTTALYPQNDVQAKWVLCSPSEMRNFSAAGYFFGKEIHDHLHVPVGLINSTWGGTPAEVWTPSEIIYSDTMLKKAAALLTNSTGWPVEPGILYNAMIYPIANYTIAGAIWYQGEANVGTWYAYRQLLTTMISSWRKAWRKDFPFYFVQIAPFAGYGKSSSSAFLREAQTQVSFFPNSGMVVTSDLVNDINDIHPKLKKEVGLRLANYAMAQTYGIKSSGYRSPLYANMKIEKDRVRISFDNTYGGLYAKGGEITGFYIAGDDRKFVAAKAKIEGNTVVVSNNLVSHPVAVRFGFTNSDMPNLYSKDGLPVNLFRTDNWETDTVN